MREFHSIIGLLLIAAQLVTVGLNLIGVPVPAYVNGFVAGSCVSVLLYRLIFKRFVKELR